MSGRLFNKTTPINAKDAVIVQNKLIKMITDVFPDKKCFGLGSVGRKNDNTVNGDIDIAIQCNNVNELYDIIKVIFIDENIITTNHLYIVSICFEWQKNNYVQVDFMPMKYPEYTQFRYYCPNYKNDESKYKTGLKIVFMDLLFNYTNERFENYNELLITKMSLTPICLCKYVMNKYDLTDYIKFEYEHNVNNLVHMIFNEDGNVNDFHTVENIWAAIHSDKYKYPQHLKTIEKRFFVYAAKKGYTPDIINPNDFSFTYYTPSEIIEIMKEKYICPEHNILV